MQRTVTAACCNVDSVSTLLALVDDPVVISDLEGNIAGVSHGAEQLLGYAAAEIIGRDSASIYVEDERAAHRARCEAIVLGNVPASFDATLRKRCGSLHPAQVQVALMYDADGEPASLLSNIRSSGRAARPDVTLSQARELRSLLDHTPIGLWQLDANRRFVYVNRAALAMAANEQADATGRHLREVLGEVLHQQLLPAIDRVMAGSEVTTEVCTPGRDGLFGHYLVYLQPRHGTSGLAEGCFAAIQDVTPAKVSEASLLRREQQLRATLVREINHRVKNTLQGLIGMLRLQAARGASAREVIDQSVAQLMAVAVAFGLASRHGEAPRILLCDLVADVASSLEQVSQRRIHVQLSAAAVRAPIVLAEQHGANISLIINELVFNAIKHSANAAGHRGVRISVDRNGDSAELRVVNEAGRLPPEFSLESGSGLGTGLNLIKALVPREGGSLSITPAPEGVCAQLTLRHPALVSERI